MENEIFQLLKLAQAGDKQCQAEIVERNSGLVWSVVKKFHNRNYELEDLFQVGCIGLIKAIRRFDAKFEAQFSTYAVPVIMGEIRRFIRDDGTIKVSRSLVALASKANKLRRDIVQETGNEPTFRDLAEKLHVPKEDLILALESSAPLESLNADFGENKPLQDTISLNINHEENSINNILVSEATKDLNQRDKDIIIMRYFQQKTQTQIATILNISQVQVSRIERKLLLTMREKLKKRSNQQIG